MNILAPDSRLWATAGRLAELGQGAGARIPGFGAAALDGAVVGRLPVAALHEIHAAADDAASGAAFALLLAVHALDDGRPILWVRERKSTRALGHIHAPGLAELGVAPARLIHVEADDAVATLRVAADAARCAGLGAVVIEPWGDPPALDLTATRRLMLATQASGVMGVLLRIEARASPSAAQSRWQVRAAPSLALEAEAPGLPAFDVCLLRQRGGIAGIEARLEWNRDEAQFRAQGAGAPLSGAVFPLAADRTAAHPSTA